ncbi:MAG: hypothetical protein WBA74_11090, partial [Cyclobacteriaceae bacterium]
MKNFYHNNIFIKRAIFLLLLTALITGLSGMASANPNIISTTDRGECDASFAYSTDADSLNYTFYALGTAQEYTWIIDDEMVSFDSTFSYQFSPNDTASITLNVHNFGENCTTVQQIVTGTEQECDASFAYTTDADSLNYTFYALGTA